MQRLPLFTDTGYTRIVIPRDSATQIVSLYAAGQSVYSFQDSTGLAVYDSNKILYFLTDDSIVTGESTTVQIAALRIYNYALDSATAKNLFLIGGPSGIPLVENSVSLATLYPNPTSSRLYIKLNNNLDNAVVEIYNIQEALMQQNRVSSSDNVSLVNLASGMYVVKIYSGNQVMFSKIAKE